MPPTQPRATPPAENEPTELPPLPADVARVDALSETFVQLLSHRPHLPGDIIANRYELEKLLGDGAMGQVFAATNLAIRRRVAIKVLKAEVLADAQFRQRFQREAEAIARIDHRNVAHFIDLVVGDPTFLVMEYVAGPTLSSVLRKEGRLEARRAIAIAVRLCWALEAAHQAGVIHRDVKPGNVILAPDPELGEEPKLIDFGLAKLASTVGETPTRVGQIVGTPQYMAPEQIANQPVDARADVYGLGCVLYHLIAGRPPFEGDSDVQLMYQHMQAAPRPLTGADLPDGLQAILSRAMAKSRESRYGSMRELANALSSLERRRLPAPGFRDAAETTDATRRTRRGVQVMIVGTFATLLAAGAGWLAGHSKSALAAETLLVVDTKPLGAQVELDGKPLPAPAPVALNALMPGRHVLRASSKGRNAVERVVELKPGEREVLVLQLPPPSHSLHVETNPAGAQAFLDGKIRGLTPITLDLSDDDFHELRLEKAGYEVVVKGLPPDLTDPNLSLTLQNDPRPMARLTVVSDAPLPVFIDGVDTGFVAPTIELEVPAGAHQIELRDDRGQVQASEKLDIARGETRRLVLSSGLSRGHAQ